MFEPRQPLSIHLTELPSPPDWPGLDAWLATWLGQPPPEWPGAAGLANAAEANTPIDTAARLAWRVALAAQALLDASGIPMLAAGEVHQVQPDPQTAGGWHCELRVPVLAGVSAQLITQAHASALAYVQAAAQARHGEAWQTDLNTHLTHTVLPALLAHAVATPSTMALLRAAHAQGMAWQHEGQGVFQLGWGRHGVHLVGSRLDSDSALGIRVAGHKLLAAQWLRRAGLPASQHQMVSTLDHAAHAARLLGWPVVLKPVNRDRGEGVSVQVGDGVSLRAAFAHAVRYSPQVLVEKQAPGVCHRLLVVRGQVLYAVKRLPVAVQGDGASTARQLIAAAHAHWRGQPPWRRPPPLLEDAQAQASLQQAGLSLDATVPSGQWAPLRLIESTADGGRDEDVMACLHPDNVALAIRAAALFGLEMAGVDVISTDISVPWHANEAIVNEVNASPTLGASQMSLDAMPVLLARLVPGDGRITVEAVLDGPGAWAQAQARQQAHIAQGRACYLSTEATTWDAQGQEVVLTTRGLMARCQALLLDKAVGALVIVAPALEWARLRPWLRARV